MVLFIFWEEEGNEKEKETSISCLSHELWYQTHYPGMCPDWESNQWPFTLQYNAQPTSPTSQDRKYQDF